MKLLMFNVLAGRQQSDHLGGQYLPSSGSGEEKMVVGRRRERKGWKVAIHDLSSSAVATLSVPATGCCSSCAATCRLEVWRECAQAGKGKDAVSLRLHLLPERLVSWRNPTPGTVF
jgi:hypothetical protein